MRLDIQGLRALAVIAVMIYHANASWLPAGYLGVDVFFVISGFIISLSIFKEKKTSNFNWLKFYWNRIKRILPAYLILLVISSLVSTWLFLSKDFTFFKSSLASAIGFTSNQYFANFGDYFAPSSHELPLLHTWSLALEMQFYLLLPILLIFINDKYLKLILPVLLLTILCWNEYLISYLNKSSYFSLVARIPEFLFGVLVAFFFQKNSLSNFKTQLGSVLGLILVIVSFFVVKNESVPGFMVFFPCIGIVLILLSPGSIINKVLSAPVFVWIGDISYSLYLWHWPILAYARYYLESYRLSVTFILIYFVSSILIAWLSYRFIETPLRLSKNKKTPLAFISISVLIISISLFIGDGLNKKIAPPLSQTYLQYANNDDICHGKIIGDCLQGDRSSNQKVLVIGDSHAAHLNFFFNEIGQSSSVKFKILTASSCVPIPGFDIERLPDWAQAPCLAQIEEIQKELTSFEKIILGGSWEYQAKSELFLKSLEAFLGKNNKHQILVMAQIPMFNQDVLRLERFTNLGLGKRLEENSEWKKKNLIIKELTSKFTHVSFLDFSDSSFFQNAPYFQGELIYHDRHHLNEIGSKRYGAHAKNDILNFINESKGMY